MSDEHPENSNKKIEINENLEDTMKKLNIKQSQNRDNTENDNGNENENENIILKKIEHSQLIVNQLDYYANSIPLGSFCFAITFILYGFHECKIHKQDDSILYTTILLFGGIGQITTGIFEYIKSRTFPCALYFIYGLYCLSFFLAKYSEHKIFNEYNQRIFYGSWAFLIFPIYIGSFKTNIFLSIQILSTIIFFIVKCIGVCFDISALKEIVAGILELVAGFSSLYICFGQILNEHYNFQLFPAVPFMKNNDIDNIMK